MERLLELVSFDAADQSGQTLTVDAAYVDRQLAELAGNEDLARYIL
jgi:ATP-dependent HslUV protease ATP-binding subunit HslU